MKQPIEDQPNPCTLSRAGRPLVVLHVGDLHLTAHRAGAFQPLLDREARLERDLDSIFKDIKSIDQDSFDFVYLPGDLAENAHPREYRILARILGRHPQVRIRLIPGDHDIARGTMKDFANFRNGLTGRHAQAPTRKDQCVEAPLKVDRLPPADSLSYNLVDQYYYEDPHRGVLCLFLDMVSAGYGQKGKGLDFRLGRDQWKWLEKRVSEAKQNEIPCAVFMHCYPADMHEPGDVADVTGLFWDGGVRLVEMGHTHYNEIAHDGRTQYATARSVGQNEDGPVGYAVVALDGKVTSWRFKQLQQTWPFVLITSPADRRLATGPLEVGSDGKVLVRALILTDQAADWGTGGPKPLEHCEAQGGQPPRKYRYQGKCSVDGGEWKDMTYVGDNMFELCVDWPPGSTKISVQVTDGRWESRMQDFTDVDSIEPAPRDSTSDKFTYKTKPEKPGSGAFQVGAWKVKGIRGDQLGPNSGGRKW